MIGKHDDYVLVIFAFWRDFDHPKVIGQGALIIVLLLLCGNELLGEGPRSPSAVYLEPESTTLCLGMVASQEL